MLSGKELKHNAFEKQFEIGVNAINSLPRDKLLDCSKQKELAEDKINVTEKFEFVLGRVENMVGKGENAFSSFPTLLSKGFFPRVI